MPPAHAPTSCCCRWRLSVSHLPVCPSPSGWVFLRLSLKLPQCPHSTSYYKCFCWRSIVWGNSSTDFVFWVPLTLNKNGVCVLISQVHFGFGLFAVKEGRIANLISSSNQKFSHWKNHVSCSMENRLEAERREVGRHVRRADPALGSWCWTQRFTLARLIPGCWLSSPKTPRLGSTMECYTVISNSAYIKQGV